MSFTSQSYEILSLSETGHSFSGGVSAVQYLFVLAKIRFKSSVTNREFAQVMTTSFSVNRSSHTADLATSYV